MRPRERGQSTARDGILTGVRRGEPPSLSITAAVRPPPTGAGLLIEHFFDLADLLLHFAGDLVILTFVAQPGVIR